MRPLTRYLFAATAVAGILGSLSVSRATLDAVTATATFTVKTGVSQQCTVANARPCAVGTGRERWQLQ